MATFVHATFATATIAHDGDRRRDRIWFRMFFRVGFHRDTAGPGYVNVARAAAAPVRAKHGTAVAAANGPALAYGGLP
jgi:hypothetical protein